MSAQLIDKQQYENLFRLHYSELCSFAVSFLDDLEDAEEIVQDIFVSLWNNINDIKINVSFRAYLFMSVKNSCLNKIKHIKIREKYKQFNEKEIENNFIDIDKIFNANELELKIKEAIEKLPTERKRIFILSRYEDLKYKEIAEKLNISIKTVENQISSALKFLRNELAEYLTILFLFFLNF